MEATSISVDAVLETLRSRGWCFGDLDEVNALIQLQSALADDVETSKVADSVESELLNMDLRSIGGKSLPEPNLLLRKSSHLQGPKVLQISSVRDISRSSMEEFSGNSRAHRLLRLCLTDGQTEITAIEYHHVPSIPNDIVPGTKVRLENKIIIHSGIVRLNPKVITVLGGVVQSLHEEWEMNRKYSGISRDQKNDTSGPPPFEKLQIEAPSKNQFAQPRRSSYFSESSSKRSGPSTSDSAVNTERRQRSHQTVELKTDNLDTSLMERTEEKPSTSEARPKEVVESVPVQNQAASQKLLQKMSKANPNDQRSRGRKYRGKERQEEPVTLTLDEWEKRKTSAKLQIKNEHMDTSHDEDLAWQLQSQLDLEDYHVQKAPDTEADNIRLSMFNYEREDNRGEHGGRGRGRGKGKGRKGKGRGRGRFG
ncbi:hypothetical protein SLA2020_038660 [Shorea laevis]